MEVEGFDFERSAASAFTRGDRELGAPAMIVIVDSLKRALASLTEETRAIMARETATQLGNLPDEPAARSTSDSTANALARARFTAVQLSTFAFRIEALNRQIDQYLVEIHKKYSIPTACIVFVLVGVPLGIMARRGGFGTAATLSLGFFVLYWACLIGGEKLADRDILSPFLGMWGANMLIAIVGAYLTFRIGRETLLIDWTLLTRFVPRRWRPMAESAAESQ
jgi:lipopolysaccharide export system permease protein